MRLDKYLALAGLGSRRDVRALVRAGRVAVDGAPARDAGVRIDPETAAVRVDGERLIHRARELIMLNKPAGVITAAADPRHQTVMDLLPRRFVAAGCMPVGRLDRDADGLLLLTTDGQLAHRLLSPRRHVDKVYRVTVDGQLAQADVEAFSAGIALAGFTALPAVLEILPAGTEARVTVREGKYHQVKRMFAARGRTVTRLTRIAFAGLALDAALAPGDWRHLTEGEEAALIAASRGENG